MSMLAWYFAKRVLHEAGWPRKLGRFKGERAMTQRWWISLRRRRWSGALFWGLNALRWRSR